MQRFAIFALALVILSPAFAAELTVLRREQRIGVRIQDLDFPESLRKELVSGLTNRVLLRIRLERDDEVLEQAHVEVAVRYDLWEEAFHYTTHSPDGETNRVEGSIDAVIRALGDLRLENLFVLRSNSTDTLQVEVDALLNPIDRERMDKIRQWVAATTTNAPGVSGTTTRTASAASDLFARIFEQYASGEEVAAVWRRSLASKPFKPQELPSDAP